MQESHHFDQTEEMPHLDLDALPILYATKMQGGVLFIPEEEVLQQLADAQEHITVESADPKGLLATRSTQPIPMQKYPPQAGAAPKVGILPVALVLLINCAIVLSAVLATLLQTVTIVIMPKTQQITEHLTLVSLQSRVFSPLTLTQRKTVPTTGHGYQPATQAQGTITFYNALTQPQTVYAGTLLVDSHGLQIVTAEDATIPSAAPPIEGQVSIAAHAVLTGSAGNISAGDLNGPCCRSNITVSNTAFSGGEDSRNFPFVTKQDIQHVSSTLLPTVTQAITTSFERQVRPSETLTQAVCSQRVNADYQVGEEASSVTVTLSKSCVAAAYTTTDLQTNIVQLLSQREPGYKLRAYLQLAPLDTSLHGNRLSISATYQATYRYQFTQAETDKVLSEIKGKQTRQVARLLEQLPGVEHITITAPANQDTIPIDESYIHLLIQES